MTEPETRLRPMTQDDLAAAHLLSRECQWPHRLDDWQFTLALGQGVVAERGGTLVGTAMWWPYGDKAASLGMVIVSQSCRGSGIGRRLMDAVIARDKAKAQELIERHIRETTENVIKYAGHLFAAPDEDRRHRADHVAVE